MSSERKRKLGLIVNPIAGLGGRVGLKGSDGVAIQRRAFELGAVPESHRRVALALQQIKPIQDKLALIAAPGEMGQDAAESCGIEFTVVGSIKPGQTTAADTMDAAKAMRQLGVDLLLFAGGDGTARDIADVIGDNLLVLGIPTGVKMHSAVFAVSPESAGELALATLQGRIRCMGEAEVMDIDEDALRQGLVAPKLYGYLTIPYEQRLVQGIKAPSVAGDQVAAEAIAVDVIHRIEDGALCIVGPGTTTRAILSRLKLEKTLVGVDVVSKSRLLARDVNERQLLDLLREHEAKIIVTPIGGQGYLFGRGNQQISPRVIKRVGRDNIIVVATPDKLDAFGGRPLLVDTGDAETDRMLSGYVRVVCGRGDYRMVRVSCTGRG